MEKCSSCGRELRDEDFGKEWRRCRYCDMPLCFDCTHYLGVHVEGLYSDYMDVVCVCEKCKPKKVIN